MRKLRTNWEGKEKLLRNRKTKTEPIFSLSLSLPPSLPLSSPSLCKFFPSLFIHGRETQSKPEKLIWIPPSKSSIELNKTHFLELQCGLPEDPWKKTKIWAEPWLIDLTLNQNQAHNHKVSIGGWLGHVDLDLMVCILMRAWAIIVGTISCFPGDSARVVVVVDSDDLGPHRRRCSFTSRLAWEASRYRAAMALLTWWRSRSQLATFLIEPFSIPFLSSLSYCHLSSFSLLLLPLKVSTSVPHLVLYVKL